MNHPKILMYTTAVCPYCQRAKSLLQARGVDLAQIEEIRIDTHPEKMQEMMDKTQRRTVPQIFIGQTHVGGCDDLYALDGQGKLEALLSASA
jgi:glutaredoxin 3